MKKTTQLSLLLLSSVAFASIAQANAPYILGQVGASNIQSDIFWRSDTDQVGFTGRLAVGYLWDNSLIFGNIQKPKYLCFDYGLELAYQYYNKANDSDTYSAYRSINSWSVSYHRQAVDLLGVLNIKPTQRFDVFVKFGPAAIIEKVSVSAQSVNNTFNTISSWSDSESQVSVVPKVVGGLGYNVTKKINLNLAVNYEFETNRTNDVVSGLAGLQYNFA